MGKRGVKTQKNGQAWFKPTYIKMKCWKKTMKIINCTINLLGYKFNHYQFCLIMKNVAAICDVFCLFWTNSEMLMYLAHLPDQLQMYSLSVCSHLLFMSASSTLCYTFFEHSNFFTLLMLSWVTFFPCKIM
jgi:hypothetical protein